MTQSLYARARIGIVYYGPNVPPGYPTSHGTMSVYGIHVSLYLPLDRYRSTVSWISSNSVGVVARAGAAGVLCDGSDV